MFPLAVLPADQTEAKERMAALLACAGPDRPAGHKTSVAGHGADQVKQRLAAVPARTGPRHVRP